MKVLIVEDEFLIAHEIATTLADAGHDPLGPFARAAQALQAIRTVPPDAAVLDVNLADGGTSAPVAAWLDRAGVPFVFLSAESHRDCPLLQEYVGVPKVDKPMEPNALLRELEALLT